MVSPKRPCNQIQEISYVPNTPNRMANCISALVRRRDGDTCAIWMVYMLGNVVISKKFLRTHRIMVMHSNERGEGCLRTLVDRKRKRYINAVDVVVRLHVRPIQVAKARHLQVLHTYGSVTSSPSRSSKRGEVVDEFRQHDGVVTMLVKNNLRRASPKHYGNYDGG